MPSQPDHSVPALTRHHLSWSDFDALASGTAGPEAIRRLREAERSRRLLLIRAIIDTAKSAAMFRPLASPESAWELMVRAQHANADSVEQILAHPYTGSWAGYTIRLYRQGIVGTCPLWVHVGHVHCLAAAAAVLAGISFETEVPAWQGSVALPTLGVALLPTGAPYSVAVVRRREDFVEVVGSGSSVNVGETDPRWHSVREISLHSQHRRLSVRLDDVDPYRGLYAPKLPSRLTTTEIESWRVVLEGAWHLLDTHLPAIAEALPEGFESVVPDPAVPFRLPSASTGEAFGSAIIAYSDDPAALAAALVHEFQHIRLGGLLHLTRLHEDDERERFYAPWRDDPRPLGGVIHGIYAFFGVAAFWRSLSRAQPHNQLAGFEFALWRTQTWRTLQAVRDDGAITPAGRRFLTGIATELGSWQVDPVASVPSLWAKRAIADHYAGWRIRHLRPDPDFVDELAVAFREGAGRPGSSRPTETLTTLSDGHWPDARTDLIRLRLGANGARELRLRGPLVPGATPADLAFVAGKTTDAITGYRAELAADPDSASALAGLGIALSISTMGAASHTLVHRPELVRAVHRALRPDTDASPEAIAEWLGPFTSRRR
ncbi:HEXXH motif domain-containing protein [Amycolatopsis sp. NPDC098790]|uniref:HEXXH motif domain-containing protein n=1 Tax=Amycolatopsis sp. NPDC098790 TaxID=3363939 RepID=UPI0037F16292